MEQTVLIPAAYRCPDHDNQQAVTDGRAGRARRPDQRPVSRERDLPRPRRRPGECPPPGLRGVVAGRRPRRTLNAHRAPRTARRAGARAR